MFITQNYDASGFYNFQPAGSCPVGWYFVYGWNVTREAIAYLAQAECTLTWVEWAGMMELSGICRMANVATVKGDIHDIGKNIVKVLLENYSFEVVDLGKDVPPETIVDTVVAQQIRLVGLSALMTTTVVSMEETIRQLREKAPWCKVMVGGAVLNQEYADMIGADFYGKDAMQSVYYAQGLLQQ